MTLSFFFFNDTATTEIYTLSLHDALPICCDERAVGGLDSLGDRAYVIDHTFLLVEGAALLVVVADANGLPQLDRKSTRLNSSHANISYAVFCLKKKKKSTLDSRINSKTLT